MQQQKGAAIVQHQEGGRGQLPVMIGDFIHAKLGSSRELCKHSSNTFWSYQFV